MTAIVTAPVFGGTWKQFALKNIINSFRASNTQSYNGVIMTVKSFTQKGVSAGIGFMVDRTIEGLKVKPEFNSGTYSRFKNLSYKP